MLTGVTIPPTDFRTWTQENLANLARDLWADNQRLTEANNALVVDLRLIHDAWRAEVIQREGQPNNLRLSA